MADHSYVRHFTDHTYARVFPNSDDKEYGIVPYYSRVKRKRGGSCCCVIGCSNREGNGVKFHRFPMDADRRARWIAAVNRDNWQPSVHTRICGDHFIKGKSDDNQSPDYVPTIYNEVKSVFNQSPSFQSVSITPSKVKWKKRRLGYRIPSEIVVIANQSAVDGSSDEESEDAECSAGPSEPQSIPTLRRTRSRTKKSKHSVSADKADAVLALLELGRPLTRSLSASHPQTKAVPETKPSSETKTEETKFTGSTLTREPTTGKSALPDITKSHTASRSPTKQTSHRVIRAEPIILMTKSGGST